MPICQAQSFVHQPRLGAVDPGSPPCLRKVRTRKPPGNHIGRRQCRISLISPARGTSGNLRWSTDVPVPTTRIDRRSRSPTGPGRGLSHRRRQRAKLRCPARSCGDRRQGGVTKRVTGRGCRFRGVAGPSPRPVFASMDEHCVLRELDRTPRRGPRNGLRRGGRFRLVGLAGIEPATSALSVLRSNRLSYSPAWFDALSPILPSLPGYGAGLLSDGHGPRARTELPGKGRAGSPRWRMPPLARGSLRRAPVRRRPA